MLRALELAQRGGRAVMPNPMVGAVVVHNNQIVGEGYHQHFGGPHAEVHAISAVQSKEVLQHSTLYVTLEPCSHFGKTPPCADLIIDSGVPRVVIGCRDPFPEVAGRGITKLRNAGVEVVEDVGRDPCLVLNRRFIIAHRFQRPYILLKWAETSDRFIAPTSRIRTWISSEHSKKLVHRWRAQEMAIMVGTTTALVDDPQLTVRSTELCDDHCMPITNPIRVTIDRIGSLPRTLNIFNTEAPTIIFSNQQREQHDTVTYAPLRDDASALPHVCTILHQRGILSLIVEGGQRTLQSFLDAGLWDEARIFHCPKVFGSGVAAPRMPDLPHSSMQSGADTLHIYPHPELATRLGVSYSPGEMLGALTF
jgi:diaminohydroxyphosphoribosylaminopyrimidine deaminase/5-amino-6-(5-phosphoribosylamino)uracil reductase